MQFIMYGVNESPESSAPPSQEMLAELGKFTEEMFKAGVLVATGSASPQGTRLKLSGGKFTTTDGPFIEAKELTGGFAILNAGSLEEAVELAKRFRSIVGEGESEIVRIFGPDDFGSQ
jgi:hypothetical protein